MKTTKTIAVVTHWLRSQGASGSKESFTVAAASREQPELGYGQGAADFQGDRGPARRAETRRHLCGAGEEADAGGRAELHHHVAPAHALAPARAQGLARGFFPRHGQGNGVDSGQSLGRQPVRLLLVHELGHEAGAPALERLGHPGPLHEVDAQADHHPAHDTIGGTWTLVAGRTYNPPGKGSGLTWNRSGVSSCVGWWAGERPPRSTRPAIRKGADASPSRWSRRSSCPLRTGGRASGARRSSRATSPTRTSCTSWGRATTTAGPTWPWSSWRAWTSSAWSGAAAPSRWSGPSTCCARCARACTAPTCPASSTATSSPRTCA